jgi:hypothetical protein
VDVGSGAEVFVFLWLVVVDDQGHCADIYTSANSLGTQEYLNLFVTQFCDSVGFRVAAVFRVLVKGALSAGIGTVSVNVIDFEVGFTEI